MVYKNGGLKNVDVRKKITSRQCSWIKRLDQETMITVFIYEKSFQNT